jgi:hydroxymethylbilane synthase
MDGSVRIGTRGSALAMAQAGLVRDAFAEAGAAAEFVIIETEGDRRAPDTAWGEGAFVAAIERALLDHRVDVAVHSAKDIPTDEDQRLRISAYLPRADARDALVVGPEATEHGLKSLPSGARVGTDSPRRTAFIRATRPDLVIHPLHGNVDTRLRRLDGGETDALVLACAGLDRLALSHRIAERLDPAVVPPAPGQGAIAIQVRSDDEPLLALGASIDDAPTRAAVEAERAFLAASGGGCRAPIGAIGVINGEILELLGGHARVDGRAVSFGRASGPVVEPVALGRALADRVARPSRLRVLVTRATAQVDSLRAALHDAGLEPVLVAAIEIEGAPAGSGIDRAVRRLAGYRWVVVTSANGARAIATAARRSQADLGSTQWASVGAATGAALEAEGIVVAFAPSESTSSALASELPVANGDTVLVVRGDLADDALPRALKNRGASVDDVVGYQTREAPEASLALLRAALDEAPLDAILFTSGSTVRGLQALARDLGMSVNGIPAICIGPETAQVASAAGFSVLATAPSPNAATLAHITAEALSRPLQERS